ncbi:DUF742 domain-containing protein [Salinactinospora qingdaonensis]|uniref:DUF742 domain-containing protein n=1 Tax=Salinactinospora qingdaonensis TaxID=702744 RepID=UPI003CD08E07
MDEQWRRELSPRGLPSELGFDDASGPPRGAPKRHRTAPTHAEAPDAQSALDSAAGPLVRPYTMTGGRTRFAEQQLDMISVVMAVEDNIDWDTLEPEHVAILELCATPMSVAELSAHLDLPLRVTKVLLGDLIDKEAVLTRAPLPTAELPDMNVLQAVLDGIRRL